MSRHWVGEQKRRIVHTAYLDDVELLTLQHDLCPEFGRVTAPRVRHAPWRGARRQAAAQYGAAHATQGRGRPAVPAGHEDCRAAGATGRHATAHNRRQSRARAGDAGDAGNDPSAQREARRPRPGGGPSSRRKRAHCAEVDNFGPRAKVEAPMQVAAQLHEGGREGVDRGEFRGACRTQARCRGGRWVEAGDGRDLPRSAGRRLQRSRNPARIVSAAGCGTGAPMALRRPPSPGRHARGGSHYWRVRRR